MNCILQDVCKTLKLSQSQLVKFISLRKKVKIGYHQYYYFPYDSVSSFAHPSLSSDGKVLYFSSDMKGGYGGKDIWYIKKVKRDEWSEPINLGDEINTSGNELFPFIHADGSLYFSSDGHVGMGGLDIFKATFDAENNLRSVDNMNSPINSSNDDFGIIFEDEEEKGYLSSNRVGSKGDDIYRFNLPKLNLTLSGVITDLKTKQIITGATIDIVGSDGSTSQTITDNSGRYLFDEDFIKENVSYDLQLSLVKVICQLILLNQQLV